MHQLKIQYSILAKRLALLFFIYFLMRALFCFFNYSYFNDLSFSELVVVFVAGLRFDLVAITISNIVFLTLHILPLRVFFTKTYQTILAVLFYVFNIAAIIFNCVDFAYYQFILKRSTADLFQVLMLGSDIQNTIGDMAKSFWHVPVLLAVIIFSLVFTYKRINVPMNLPFEKSTFKQTFLKWFTVIPVSLIIIVSFRGGTQYKPLGILAAANYTAPQNAPLVLNTTFTIIKTAYKDELQPLNYFTDAESKKYFNPEKNYASSEPFKPKNVVIIILESFGKEYIGAYNKGKGYTPFLDSLIAHSLTFRYSYANSKKSIEGIPAVTASIPALMDAPYITSVYNGNKINSLASVLKSKGYTSAFFHGGNNGTMGFDNFTKMAGYDKYYGRNEYGAKDYDGSWGIFDEPFYHFFADKMTAMKQPFVTTFFSISSHHPYTIPEKYKGRFPKGTMEMHESVGYSDFALKTFFEYAAKQLWYANTLFVITADHTSEAESTFYKNKMGIYSVPVIFYTPDDSLTGYLQTITQQSDIMPSVLDYLHFDKPFVSFGNSFFNSSEPHFTVQFMNDSYQIFSDDKLIQFDGENILSIYNFKQDSLLKHNLLKNKSADTLKPLNEMKAYIQQFNQRLIKNRMSPLTPKGGN